MNYIPFETIVKFLGEGKPLNIYLISYHEKFTFDLVERFPKACWNWDALTKKASMQFILDHPKGDVWKWSVYAIVENKIPPIDFIKDNITEFRNEDEYGYFSFSMNRNITKEFIEEFIDEKWCWDFMFRVGIIDFDFVIKHKSKIKNYKEILINYGDPERLYQTTKFAKNANRIFYEFNVIL